jgi:HEAT repeats
MKPTLFLLLLLATPAFAITIKTLDVNKIDDTAIEITAPVWDGTKAGPVLVGTFESKFDRKVANKLASGFRNGMMPSYDLAPSLDLGQVFAAALRAEGTKLGLTMMSPQEAKAPQWTIDGTIHSANIDIQHMGYGSLLFYTYLDVDVRVTKQGAQPVTHRIRPARLFVMFNGGMGIGDEVQAALAKILVTGAQQILARLNREHFEAPVLPTMETRLVRLNKIDDRGEAELHAIGLSGVRGASAALASRLESERDENARTSIVYALTSLGAEEHVPLLARRFASEDDDVRYATIIALASIDTPEALALIREKGTKDKTLIIRKLSERLLAAR